VALKSVKAIWCFEPIGRRYASTVKWDTPVRVRHVASGRYLAIDTTKPIQTFAKKDEEWFSTYLVDDEIDDEDDSDNAESNKFGYKYAKASAMEFFVSSAEMKSSHIMSDLGDFSLMLVHRVGNKKFYLHGSTNKKSPRSTPLEPSPYGIPKPEKVQTDSFQLVFSNKRHASDVLKLIRAGNDETRAVSVAVACMPHLASCTLALQAPQTNAVQLAEDIAPVLLMLLSALAKVEPDTRKPQFLSPELTVASWLKKASQISPSELKDDKVLMMEPEEYIQNMYHDVKILDAVWAIVRTISKLRIEGSPLCDKLQSRKLWGGDLSSYDAVHALETLAFVTISKIFVVNSENQIKSFGEVLQCYVEGLSVLISASFLSFFLSFFPFYSSSSCV